MASPEAVAAASYFGLASGFRLPPDSERDRGQIHHPSKKFPGVGGEGELVACRRAIGHRGIAERRHGTIGTGGGFVVCLPKYGGTSSSPVNRILLMPARTGWWL